MQEDRRGRLHSTGEVARELGVSTRALSRWAKEGSLTPALVTPGGRYKWDLEDVRRQLRDMR
ncbi:MerR HTH family regulatory protein [Haloechinothrix alba]|uniref:MerR HTH family regulatory protein n=1 Tax=Haloechinothrix alba TaxID=664784 RepID=A0A238WN51_9PSEU|nr:MerR family transcriptional regulator [Haloechinothrix alba]SNR47962.1 MerR HTH family regulatory protein [Haloechinothrix alba]